MEINKKLVNNMIINKDEKKIIFMSNLSNNKLLKKRPGIISQILDGMVDVDNLINVGFNEMVLFVRCNN